MLGLTRFITRGESMAASVVWGLLCAASDILCMDRCYGASIVRMYLLVRMYLSNGFDVNLACMYFLNIWVLFRESGRAAVLSSEFCSSVQKEVYLDLQPYW